MAEQELTPASSEEPTWSGLSSPSDGGRAVQEDASLAFPITSSERDITQALQPLFAEIAGLRRDFESKLKYDSSKERVIESLHRELQFHQQGLHFRILQPLFMDLIALYDDIGKLIDRQEQETPAGSELFARHLRMFQETIEEILRRNGVEAFTLDEDVFVPQKQRSLKVIAVPELALDKHIARRVRPGFLAEDKLLRPELVDIYKYKSPGE